MVASVSTIRANWNRKRSWARYVASLGLTSWWRFNDPTGTQAIDRLGGNHGTYQAGPTLGAATSIPDDATDDASVVFAAASSQYMTVPDATNLALGDTFTLGGIAKRTATGTKHYLVQKGTAAFGVYVGTDNKLTLEKPGTADIVKSTVTIGTGWFFWVVTKAAAAVKVYVVQVGTVADLDATGVVTNQTCTSTVSALEWGRSAVPDSYLNGSLDEGFVGAAVLTPLQVSVLAAAFLQGELGGPFDDITSRVTGWTSRNGRPATGGSDQIGQLGLVCRNKEPSGVAHFFTPERNLVPNASFGSGLHDLSTTLAPLAAGGVLSWIADAPAAAGAYAARCTTTAANHGLAEPLEGLFRSGQKLTLAISARADAGTPTLQYGLGSTGTPADAVTASAVLSTTWQDLAAVTWTASADRTDAAWFARDNAGAGISFRISKVRVNRGASANAWLDAPTWPMLQPGALVHLKETSAGTDYHVFAGHVDDQGWTTDPLMATVTVQDAFQDLSVPIDLSVTARAAWTVRQQVIDAAIRKVEGAYENLCTNGSFPVNTAGWSLTGTAARNTAEKPVGTASIEIPGDSAATYNLGGTVVPLTVRGGNRPVTLVFQLKLRGAADDVTVVFGRSGASNPSAARYSFVTGTAQRPSPTSTGYTTYSAAILLDVDTTALTASFTPVSGTTAKGVFLGGVMIVYGYDVPAFVDFGAPSGRLYNWLSERATTIEQGWSNRVANPEAVTDLAGWTGVNRIVATEGFTLGSNASSQTYSPESFGTVANALNLIAVIVSHATSADLVTLSQSGVTWTAVAGFQFSGGTRRLVVFRSLTAGTLSMPLTVTVAGTGNTGMAYARWQFTNVNTTGINGAGAVQQSVTASGTSVTSLTVTLAAPASMSNIVWAAFANTGGSLTAGTNYTAGAGPTEQGTMLKAEYTQPPQGTAIMTGASGDFAGIAVEVKNAAVSGLTRGTTGGYAGGFATAFVTGAGGITSAVLSGTFRSGHTYQVGIRADTLAAGVTYTIGVQTIAGADRTTTTVAGQQVHGTGASVAITFVPTADRTSLYLYLFESVSSGALTFSGAYAMPGAARNYARAGFVSPVTLDEADTISTVTDAVLGRSVTEIVSYAAAGSGIAFATVLPQVNGVSATVSLRVRVPAGTANVTLGLGDPFGANAAVSNSVTVALTTTWRTIVLAFKGSADDLVSGSGIVAWVAAQAAVVTTFRVTDLSITLGTATQTFAPLQANGLDLADTDSVTQTLVQANARDTLAAANVSEAVHWIRPKANTPYWEYATRARQSLAAKAVSETLTSIQGLGQVNHRRQATFQRVVVTYGSATYDNLAVASSTSAIRDRTGTVRELDITTGGWVTDYATAKAIADLRLSREQIARPMPTIVLTDKVPTVFQREPDDLVLITTGNSSRDLLYSAYALSLLVRTISKSQGTLRAAQWECEEFRPS